MGTVPFVTLNLLTRWGHRGEVKHLYRHDLGSFMWVLAWVCLRYRDGKLLRSDRPLDAWATNDTETVYKKKTIFLYSFWNFKPRGVDQRIWSLVVACLLELGEQAHRRAVFMGNMSVLTEETADSGEDSMESDEGSTESDEEIPAEDVELADGVLLRKFTETEAWVQLDESLRPRSQ
jgi:hypothetical protein